MTLNPSSEATSSSTTHEFHNILWNPNVHYRVHNTPPLVLILSQKNLVRTTKSYFFKFRFNIILRLTSRFFQWSLSLYPSHQNPICIPLLPHTCYTPCTSQIPRLDNSDYIWRRVQVTKLLVMQSSPTSYHFIPHQSKYNSQHPVLQQPQSLLFF
jgi:hypothetical protein